MQIGMLLLLCFGIFIFFGPATSLFAYTVVEWDFTAGTWGWTANPRVKPLSYSSEGLLIESTGFDPWIEGPAVDVPEDKSIVLKIRIRSSAGHHAQIFYGRIFNHEKRLQLRIEGGRFFR